MATMTMPLYGPCVTQEFEVVEDNIQVVRAGVKFTNRFGFALRVIWKIALLGYAFEQVVVKQGELIDKINTSEALQNASSEEMLELAGRLEHLVMLNDQLLDVAVPRFREFKPWMTNLEKTRVQRDTLASMAESYRDAADPESQTLLVTALETLYA